MSYLGKIIMTSNSIKWHCGFVCIDFNMVNLLSAGVQYAAFITSLELWIAAEFLKLFCWCTGW